MDNRRFCLLVLLVLSGVGLGALSSLPPVHAVVTVELNSSDGSTICPNMLSGNGQAVWNATTDTCSLSTTARVSPTLCISGTVGGCVLNAIDVLQIDRGTTFAIDTTLGGVAVYSDLFNYGVVDANDVGIVVYGTLNNWGIINVSSKADILTLPFLGQGIINNFNGTIINRGVVENDATIINSGTIANYCPGVVTGNPILGNPVQNHPCAPSAPFITTLSGSVFQTRTPTITGVSEQNATIILFDGATPVGTGVSDVTGNWSITTSALVLGAHHMTATATNSLGSSPPSPSVIIFIKDPTSTSVTCASSVLLGLGSDCVVTVTDRGLAPSTPGGIVNFTTNKNGIFKSSNCSLSGVGVSTTCGVSYNPSVVGTHSIQASYAGDVDHSGSNSTFNLGVFDFAVSLTSSSQNVLPGESANFTLGVTLVAGSIGPVSTVTVSITGLPSGAVVSGLPGMLSLPGTVSFIIQAGLNSLGNFSLKVSLSTSGGSRSASTILDIVSPQQAVQRLVGQVSTLKTDGVLKSGQARNLISLLTQAIRDLNTGKTQPVCGTLKSFVNTVEGYVSAQFLTREQASQLLDPPLGANAIIASIHC